MVTFPSALPSLSLAPAEISKQPTLVVLFRSLRGSSPLSSMIYGGPGHQAPISHVVVRLELSLAPSTNQDWDYAMD